MKNLKGFITILTLICLGSLAYSQRQLENLDRGLIAIRTNSSNVYLSWRLFGTDNDSTSFNIYFNDVLLNTEPITGATNYDHSTATDGSYYIKPVVGGTELTQSKTVTTLSQKYSDINLQIPTGGTSPDGISYTYSPGDCSIGDLDGNGEYEIILKWDPSNAHDNSHPGYTGNVFLDAYKLDGTLMWRIDLGINIRAGSHYTQFMVYDFNSDGKAEIACKTAPGTKDGSDNYLSFGPAASDNDASDYRNSSGRVLSGPEYLTVFNGETGNEMATVNYNPPRGNVYDWGDSYGNRADRFLACVAYLDGINPSLVMCRGYYTRIVLAAWDWDGSVLSQRWVFDSDNGYPGYAGQGNHNLSVADVDDDGKDEIVYGSCTIDDNGSGLYTTGLGHGDALHVTDHDPDRPGLEVFMPHESGGNGITFRDAATGEIIWQKRKENTDVGRGVATDILPEYEGSEFWGISGLGVYNRQGSYVGNIPSINFAIWWDSDDLRELLDGNRINKYGVGDIFYATGCCSINGTKSTPNLQADIFGDWREEVIYRTSDNTKLRIFFPTSYTTRRQYTLMHDPQYRMSIAWQNVGYNQPPHTGFHFGNGMQESPVSPIRNYKTVWVGGSDWDSNISQNWSIDNNDTTYHNGDNVLFEMTGSNSNPINIPDDIAPASVNVISPTDYIISGNGNLTGKMDLKKDGSGTLTIENNNSYYGTTKVWGGKLIINGSLDSSAVTVFKHASLMGNGTISSLILKENANLDAGLITNDPDTVSILENLTLEDGAIVKFDLSDDTTGLLKNNDFIKVSGDITFIGRPKIEINILNDSLNQGTYRLFSFSGTFNGNIDSLIINNIDGIPFELIEEPGYLSIKIINPRISGLISWIGGKNNNVWDLTLTKNWLFNDTSVWFLRNDSVLFDDSGLSNNHVSLEGSLEAAHIEVNSSGNFSFTGDGEITGQSGISKSGTGKLIIETTNSYTGKTILNGGTIEIPELNNAGVAGKLGAADNSDNNIILNGGMLQITNFSSATNRNILLESGGGTISVGTTKKMEYSGVLSGPGKLTKSGGGTFEIRNRNNHSGGTVLKGGEICLDNENALINGLGSGALTIESGMLNMYSLQSVSVIPWDIVVPASSANAKILLDTVCQLTGSLSGQGNLELVIPGTRSELLGDWSEFTGQVTATNKNNVAWLLLGNKSGYEKSSIHLNGNVVAMYRPSSNDTIEIGKLTGTSDSRLGAGGEDDDTITWKIGGLESSFTFDGSITERQYSGNDAVTSIIKTGQGNFSLTNANVYSGPTIIEEGILTLLNTSGSGTGTGDVIIKNGGTLSGTGTVAGPVSVEPNGVISPGDAGFGSLNFESDVTFLPGSYYLFEYNNESKQSDGINVGETLAIDGILYFNITGSTGFVHGDSIKIFDAGQCYGHFSSVIPSSPGTGLEWDTTTIASDGFLRICYKDSCSGLNNNNDNTIGNQYEPELKIFPNPNNGSFVISIPGMNSNYAVKIETINSKVIYYKTTNNNSNQFSINLEDIHNGIYYVSVIKNNLLYTSKLIIQQ